MFIAEQRSYVFASCQQYQCADLGESQSIQRVRWLREDKSKVKNPALPT